MLTRFVCLANSYKEGERCIAGIELDNKNNPICENGNPKWIRPICNTEHGKVHTYLVSHINILDIIEMEITGYPEKNYQSENAFFNEDSIKVVGKYNKDNLINLCDSRDLILGNRGKAVSEEAIKNLAYSLMLIKTNSFQIIEKVYDDNPERKQLRLAFTYKSNKYNLPITDPTFINKYKSNRDFIEGINEIFVSISLGVSHEDWYYKLVAGVLLN